MGNINNLKVSYFADRETLYLENFAYRINILELYCKSMEILKKQGRSMLVNSKGVSRMIVVVYLNRYSYKNMTIINWKFWHRGCFCQKWKSAYVTFSKNGTAVAAATLKASMSPKYLIYYVKCTVFF